MGYPMTYTRLVNRNGLSGDYTDPPELPRVGPRHIAGDMRRLEQDSRDPRHLDAYARTTGLAPEQVKAVLDAFFDASFGEFDWERFPPDPPELISEAL